MNNQILKLNKELKILSPVGIGALEKLPAAQRTIISAGLQSKLKDLPVLEVVEDLTNIITTVYTIAGQKPEQTTLALYSDELYSKLMETYPMVSVDEIRAALRAGVYGEYGEYFGLNPKSFMQFITAYLYSERRMEAAKEFNQNRLEIMYSKELTPADKEESNKEFVNMLYTDFLKAVLLTDYIPAYLYDFLEQQQLIALSLEEKQIIKERAKAYYLRLNNSPKLNGPMGDHMRSYLRGIDTELITRIISKQFAVYDFFERCKTAEKQTIF